MVKLACVHSFEVTTSDKYMKCSNCGAICEAQYKVPLRMVREEKKVKRSKEEQAVHDLKRYETHSWLEG